VAVVVKEVEKTAVAVAAVVELVVVAVVAVE
jgi:hypothetical protein